MKLEEAVKKVFWYSEDRKAVGSVREVGVDEFEAILALLSHAESTRWRKLEEEKPPSFNREYQVAVGLLGGGILVEQKYWYFHDQLEAWGFNNNLVTHWRPIVGPEEES